MKPERFQHCRQVFRDDVGAHIGFYSLLGSIINPEIEVHAFEPFEPVFRRLSRNIELNGLQNIKANRIALGASAGAAAFYAEASPMELGRMTGHQSCNPDAIDAETFGVAELTVPMSTGDEYCGEDGVGPVGLVKIDTELTEDRVLDGFRDALARDRPMILIEALPEHPMHAGRIWALLEPLGYRAIRLTPEGTQELPGLETHPEHRNYLMLAGSGPSLDDLLTVR